jgi:serine O-acetyltransferase
VYGVDIDYRAQLEGGIIIVHGIGLVIGSGVIIKSKVTLFHQVTIGVRGENKDLGFATVDENCTIYAGAKILGSIIIGKNSIIGANVVVTKDIPTNSIVTTDTKLLIRERQIKL